VIKKARKESRENTPKINSWLHPSVQHGQGEKEPPTTTINQRISLPDGPDWKGQ